VDRSDCLLLSIVVIDGEDVDIGERPWLTGTEASGEDQPRDTFDCPDPVDRRRDPGIEDRPSIGEEDRKRPVIVMAAEDFLHHARWS